ncbi:chaperonin GroES [Persephonella hydrogeniphila]|uniref:Co-chaperonin GroES n=1 Tax=Persephonella hydrogeniphila TaxID=198703 RepID=A0A285NGU2_9AQUI|nr:co-chaperone GroES [Persephonella hydrogeniphila]SNZ07106.1 chaperonin GroES [Persephonella hydrogeniphila]
MAKIVPLYDRVVIKPAEEVEEKTPSGIIIPDTAKEKPSEGEVIAVGEGRLLENGEVKPLKVKVGDRVIYSKYAGNEFVVDGEELIVLREDDILAIIE